MAENEPRKRTHSIYGLTSALGYAVLPVGIWRLAREASEADALENE